MDESALFLKAPRFRTSPTQGTLSTVTTVPACRLDTIPSQRRYRKVHTAPHQTTATSRRLLPCSRRHA